MEVYYQVPSFQFRPSSLKHGISSFLDDANADQLPGADARLDISGKRGPRNPESLVPAANALEAEPPTR